MRLTDEDYAAAESELSADDLKPTHAELDRMYSGTGALDAAIDRLPLMRPVIRHVPARAQASKRRIPPTRTEDAMADPPVGGGQGRTDEEVYDQGNAMCGVFVGSILGAAAWGVFILIWKAVSNG